MSTRSDLTDQVNASIEVLESHITFNEGIRQAGEQAVEQCEVLGVSESETAIYVAVVAEADNAIVALNQMLTAAQELLGRLDGD